MEFKQFVNILNETIFEQSKENLIENIAKYPSRYVGLFRPTKPKAKLLQNLLQSHEIRFGDAFERLMEAYFNEFGFELLEKNISSHERQLEMDHLFKANNQLYFIEQKVRDDHDSTKKRGQLQNFETKLGELLNRYPENAVTGILYFIDPELSKNKNYYTTELKKMAGAYGVSLHLFYGKELFDFLGKSRVWSEILEYLEQWKKQIPELPETNFDRDAHDTFEHIKDLNPAYFRTLFDDETLFNEIVLTLFPQRKTLRLLLDYFQAQSGHRTIYKTLHDLLKRRLEKKSRRH